MSAEHDLQDGPPVPGVTTRLVFRSWLPTDFDLALGLWGDPRVTAMIDPAHR